MYLNLYQKYILQLLREYDGLLKRQLEAMVKHFKEPHLYNIDGYLEQLRRFEKIKIVPYKGEDTVILPSGRINENMITAFDIMLEFLNYLVKFEAGISPVILQFYIKPNDNSEREINIVPVGIGEENTAVHYAEYYVINIAEDADKISYPPSWIFVIQDKRQMPLIKPKTNYSFVIMENGEPVFYEGQ